MPAVFPGPTNAYVPSHDASNKMVIDFARNINKFPVNKYTQVVPVTQMTGYYLEMTIEEAGRVNHTDLRDAIWYDGQPAPEGGDGTESFQYKPFRTERYLRRFLLGDLTVDQASWNILAHNSSTKSRQLMTGRTQLAINQLTTTGNYSSDHVIDVTTIAGNQGNWAQSTTARQNIKRSLNHAAERIMFDVLSAIELDDLVVVIGFELASELAESQEVSDYIKGSPEALAQIKGELPGNNVLFGLPNKLYGFPIIVESTVKVTSKKGATTLRSAILPKATPFMCARPGGIVGVADAPNFSTCVCFALEEMTVETLREPNNRRTIGRVVDNIAYNMVAPVSGFLFQAAA